MVALSRRINTPAMLLAAMVVSFAVVLGCAIASGKLLGLLERPDGSTGLDSSITSWMVAHRAHGLTTVARVFSTLGSQTVLTPLAVLMTVLLAARRRLVPAGLLFVAWGGAILLYTVTKHAVQRPRPPVEIWLTDVGRSSAFPSGHATQSLATFVALVLVSVVWLPRARAPMWILALVVALGVGWSRVYLGVHWATDVGAGWLIAAAWIAIVAWLARAASSIKGLTT